MPALLTRPFQKRKQEREIEELREANRHNGNCPVAERTGDGAGVGRCWFGLRGPYCPRHGNLSGYLKVTERGDDWQRIDENDLPPVAEREKAPLELFNDPGF